jgi:hypothetical protein
MFGFVETQPTQGIGIDNTLDHVISIESSIEDIFVNEELSLRQCLKDWSPMDLQANMLTSDGQEYKSVMVRLATKLKRRTTPMPSQDASAYKSGERTVGSLLVAGSSVVQALCGGIGPMEWKVVEDVTRGGEQEQEPLLAALNRENDEFLRTARATGSDRKKYSGGALTPLTARTSDGESRTSLGWNVLRLLQALLDEDVMLTWEIDVRHDPPHVQSALLPELA